MSKPLPYELTGNKNSGQLLVFFHGWPDTTAIWDGIVPSFEKDYYILNVSYPNLSHKEQEPKGISQDETVDRLKFTLDSVNDTKRKVVFVSHDWGSIYTYCFDQKYPNYITEIISLDIGLRAKPTFYAVAYQLYLLIAFIIGGTIGTWMTQAFIKTTGHKPAWKNRINSTWNYHYYYLWKRIFASLKDKSKFILYKYEPSCPIVYAWGKKTPVRFHSQGWLNKLEKEPKCEVHSLDSGHWIMLDQPAFVIDLIKRRLTYLKNEKTPK